MAGASAVLIGSRTALREDRCANDDRCRTDGVGAAILNWLASAAAAAGAHLLADFRRTDRNRMMEIAYCLAGFDEQDCDCRRSLPPADVDGVQRLHLAADRREPPSTMRLVTPDIGAPVGSIG